MKARLDIGFDPAHSSESSHLWQAGYGQSGPGVPAKAVGTARQDLPSQTCHRLQEAINILSREGLDDYGHCLRSQFIEIMVQLVGWMVRAHPAHKEQILYLGLGCLLHSDNEGEVRDADGFQVPSPQREQRLTCCPAIEPTRSSRQRATPHAASHPAWRTFFPENCLNFPAVSCPAYFTSTVNEV